MMIERLQFELTSNGRGGGGVRIKRLNEEISLCVGAVRGRDGLWRWPGRHCCHP